MGEVITNSLYIVATPIGNLSDITYRAVEVLKASDLIACEDTRNSSKLLDNYGIVTKTISYHDHNGEAVRPKILEALQSGKSVALISDAGSPLVNDPGYKLVNYITEHGFNVIPIPGANSPITAIMGAGLPSDIFTFRGFLPTKKTALVNELKSLNDTMGTIIYFESPKRIRTAITELKNIHPKSDVVIARELTKKFEQFIRDVAGEINVDEIPEKGEFVLLINIPKTEYTDEQVDELIIQSLKTMSVKDTAVAVALQTGKPKNQIYSRVIELEKG